MNYEKKYKEALERANKLYEQGTITESLGYVFPELKESENERIRNFLIDFIKVCTWTEKKDQGWSSREDCLAWLEKQGEQKPTLPKWKYKKDHIPLLKDSLILNKYGCVGKSPSGAIVSDVWVLDYDELAKLPKEELEEWYEFYVTKEEHLDCEDWTKKITHWMPLPQPPKEGGNNG